MPNTIPTEIYILNPEYRLRRDKKRVLLFYRRADQPFSNELSNHLGFIHPILAVLLCLFDGKKNVPQIVSEFHYLTGVADEVVVGLVGKLIENKQEVRISLGDRHFDFPINTLIKSSDLKSHQSPIQYNPTDFLIPSQEMDFDTQRLYIPLDTMMVINTRCATRCFYCYADKRKPASCTIPFTRLVEILSEARALGMRSFDLSGGELFLYQHWEGLLKKMLELDFDPHISTKFPLTADMIRILKELGLRRIQLSLDTVVKEEMIRMLGNNENYHRRILQTLVDLNRNGFEIDVNSQITSVNQDSTEQLIQYLRGFENVKLIRLRATAYSLYKDNYADVRAQKERLDKIRSRIFELRQSDGANVTYEFYEYPERRHYLFDSVEEKRRCFGKRAQCSGNFTAFYIMPDGKVTLCEELYHHPRFVLGDLTTQSIEEIWNSDKALSLYRLAQSDFSDQSACKKCSRFDACRLDKGVCWKQVVYTYGFNKWDFPDPRCHLAPEFDKILWID